MTVEPQTKGHKMNRSQVEKYILSHKDESFVEMSKATGLNERIVRQIWKELGLPPRNVGKQNNHTTSLELMKVKFKDFLSKAKTEKELYGRFGDTLKQLLKEKYEGYALFQQRNRYMELVYILLPERKVDYNIMPKKWQFHMGKTPEGINQPYILVQVPKFKGTINIAPLFDIHYGNFAHRKEKFLAYLRWIAENDNVYAILGGDVMENAIDDGRGMTYDQTENPQTQLDDMTQLLAPIAHKILVATPGN